MTQSFNEVLDRLNGALEAHRRFASDASHELRAPITAMAGEIDVALTRSHRGRAPRDLLVVQDRLAALTALCEDLILLVHAQEGAPGLELREVPVMQHLQDAAARLAAAASSRAIAIEARDLPDIVAYADPRLLARIFDNVLANAVHYNRDGGEVVVSGSAEDTLPHEWKAGTALITISDTGAGIPAGEAERVFDRFYRLDQSRARRTGGSGLGNGHLSRGVDRPSRLDSHQRVVERRHDRRNQNSRARTLGRRFSQPLRPASGRSTDPCRSPSNSAASKSC